MNRFILFSLLLIASLILVYFQSLQFGFTYLDDQVQVVNNSAINSLRFSNLKQLFGSTSVGMYQPITSLFYAFIYQFFQLNAFGYHFLALGFHIINSLLVLKLLHHFFDSKKVLFLLVSIFALHPMQVESVSWVSAFSNLVYSFFFLMSMLQYISFKKEQNMSNFLLSLFFFLLSCLSKSTAVTLPIILILLDWFHSKSIRKIDWVNKIPFFIFSILFGVITLFSRESAGHLSDLSIQFDGLQRLFLIAHSVLFYPLTFLFPFQLSVFYPYPELHENSLPNIYYLALPALLALFFLLWKWKKKKLLWLGTLFFIFTISLVLQFIPVGNQLTTDRYIYIPMIGLLLIVGSLLNKAKTRPWFYLFFSIPLLFAFKSHERSKIWENDQLIWENVIENHPSVAQAYNNLGSYVLKQNQTEKALDYFNQAIRLKPYYADAYSNRGNLLAQKGETQAALEDYSTAIKLRPHADAYFNRGNEFSKLNDLNSAITDYTESLQLNPSPDAYTNRAFAFIKQREFLKAKNDLENAILQFPNYNRSYLLLGMILQQEGNKIVACQQFEKAIRLGNKQARLSYQQNCTK